jgi:hypothetical protein
MNGPDAFPMQYALSRIALVVTRFVCPAVTFPTQDRTMIKPVVATSLASAYIIILGSVLGEDTHL